MQSTGSQADVCQLDDITDTLRSFHSQLQDLCSHTSSLIEQLRSRGENINQSDTMLDTLESRVNQMVATTTCLENALQTRDTSDEESARELDDLISERGEGKMENSFFMFQFVIYTSIVRLHNCICPTVLPTSFRTSFFAWRFTQK